MADDAAHMAEGLAFAQKIQPRSYLGLSLRNGLLNIITLTLYRFWGKTEVRRRLWSSAYLNGEPFEYTGHGKELFLGFLMAVLVVGAPFLVVVAGAQLLGPMGALIILPLYLFLIVLLGFGRFTAFRYLASRTTWRGVRFQLTGSPLKYGWKFLGYMLLTVISLGWFAPAAQRRLAAPLWGGLRFGDRPMAFDLEAARRQKVYGAFALSWIALMIGYFVFTAAIFSMAPGAVKPGGAPSLGDIGAIYGLFGIFALYAAVVYAPYQAAMLRSVIAGIGLETARFRLDIRWLDLAGLSLSNFFFAVVSLGFLAPFVEARTARFLIMRLSSQGEANLAAAHQAPMGPRTGEGLADALGMATV
jgi:uncharacterized membrane protein YjgN (DUF898 family)